MCRSARVRVCALGFYRHVHVKIRVYVCICIYAYVRVFKYMYVCVCVRRVMNSKRCLERDFPNKQCACVRVSVRIC